jgi:hypothetical protein
VPLAAAAAAGGQREEAMSLASAAERLLAELGCDRFRTLVADELRELTGKD